jgi:hypothetical protein
MKFAKDLVPQIDTLPTRQRASFPEISDETFWSLYAAASPYSLLHVTGFYNLFQSINYLARGNIPGDFVECGCFLGGAAIFMGLLCARIGLDRPIHLFDTFDGPPLDQEDVVFGQRHTGHKLPPFEQTVRDNIGDAGADLTRYTFTKGRVEETLPSCTVKDIALLRLDTDFYSPTRAQLEYLYPRLAGGGVLIIDDYGMFDGCRRATDEYFRATTSRPLLNRIDIGVWAGVKPVIEHQALSEVAALSAVLESAP